MNEGQDLDRNDTPILTAAERLSYLKRMGLLTRIQPPQGVVVCYQPRLLLRLKKKFAARQLKGFFGDFYLLRRTGGKIGLAGNFGVGAPAAVVLLEDLAAFGVRQFVSIGLAGGLQENLHSDDIVVCYRAIRDEGVSSHYIEPGKYAYPSNELLDKLIHSLHNMGLPYTPGTSWTTDTPYRETASEVTRHCEEGVLSVEMESAALYAAGAALGVDIVSAFVIADTLSGLKWRLDTDLNPAYHKLEELFLAASEALR